MSNTPIIENPHITNNPKNYIEKIMNMVESNNK
jgi:hypothetical protein